MFRAATSPVLFGFQPRKNEQVRSSTPGASVATVPTHQKFMLSLSAAELETLPHTDNPLIAHLVEKMIVLKDYIRHLEIIYGHSIELQKLETQNRPNLPFGEYKSIIKNIATQTKSLFPLDDKKDEKLAFQRLTTSLTDMRNPATKSQITYCLKEFQVIYEKLINNPALADEVKKTVEEVIEICAGLPAPLPKTSIPVTIPKVTTFKKFRPRVLTPEQTEPGVPPQTNHSLFALSPSPKPF